MQPNPLVIDRSSGAIIAARQVSSQNCDQRPEGVEPELIVLHAISLPPGQFGGVAIDRLFTNTLDETAHPYFSTIHRLQVSAHVLVRRDGSLTQYVPLHQRAWHAGESSYFGRSACNDFSIGIELEGADDIPFEAAQYEILARLVSALIARYPSLSLRRIVGHCDIAPGRKTDPGPCFEWMDFYRRLVRL